MEDRILQIFNDEPEINQRLRDGLHEFIQHFNGEESTSELGQSTLQEDSPQYSLGRKRNESPVKNACPEFSARFMQEFIQASFSYFGQTNCQDMGDTIHKSLYDRVADSLVLVYLIFVQQEPALLKLIAKQWKLQQQDQSTSLQSCLNTTIAIYKIIHHLKKHHKEGSKKTQALYNQVFNITISLLKPYLFVDNRTQLMPQPQQLNYITTKQAKLGNLSGIIEENQNGDQSFKHVGDKPIGVIEEEKEQIGQVKSEEGSEDVDTVLEQDVYNLSKQNSMTAAGSMGNQIFQSTSVPVQSNPFKDNYYSTSTKTRLTRRQISKELAESKAKRMSIQDEGPTSSQRNIKVSKDKKRPMVPLLPINQISDARQQAANNLKGMTTEDITRSASTRSAHLSAAMFSRQADTYKLPKPPKMGDLQGSFDFLSYAIREKAAQSDNMSICEGDEMDASYIQADDIGMNHELTGEQKLKVLAVQLGESCLTQDLAELTHAFREHELEVSARKVTHNKQTLVERMKQGDHVKSETKDVTHALTESGACLEPESPSVDTSNDQHILSNQIRLVMLNLIYLMLKDQSVQQLQFVRSPVNILYVHLKQSAFFTHEIRNELEMIETCEEGQQNDPMSTIEDSSKVEHDDPLFIKLKYLDTKQVFKAVIHDERKVIFKMLRMFSFVGEEIMRSQSMALGNAAQVSKSKMNIMTPVSTFMKQKGNNQEQMDENNCIDDLTNPSVFWLNGIGYEQDQSKKEKMRKSVDKFMVRMERKIKFTLNQLDLNSPYNYFTTSQSQSLANDLTILTAYLKESQSRVTIFQIIDVLLDTILNIKMVLIDGSFKLRAFNLDYQQLAKLSHVPLDSAYRDTKEVEVQEQIRKSAFRHLFCQYLKLIIIIFKLSKMPEVFKLIAEVFIADEMWQEQITTYMMHLFVSDLLTSDQKQELGLSSVVSQLGRQASFIEVDPKVTLSNLEEFNQIAEGIQHGQKLDIVNEVKQQIKLQILQAQTVFVYYKEQNVFLKKATLQFESKISTRYEDVGVDEQQLNAPSSNIDTSQYKYNEGDSTQHQQKIQFNWKTKEERKSYQYWRGIIKHVLFTYAYLIAPSNGILSHLNDLSSFTFTLTTSALKFQSSLFNIHQLFTRTYFTDELMLFYIRTHYISFIRLYNLNSEGGSSKMKPWRLKLCKQHLKCLFSIARNRNEDTRRKLYQFKIVQFLLKEIDLEFELTQRRDKFIRLRKEENQKNKQIGKPQLISPEQSIPHKLDISPPIEEIKLLASPPNLKVEEVKEKSKTQTKARKPQYIDTSSSSGYENLSEGTSSSGYDFVPRPELNPNVNKPTTSKKPAFNLSLNLNKVMKQGQGTKGGYPQDKLVTQEDQPVRESIMIENESVLASEKTVESSSDSFILNSPPLDEKQQPLNLGQRPQSVNTPVPLMGLSLNLNKVQGANVITQDDKEKLDKVKAEKPKPMIPPLGGGTGPKLGFSLNLGGVQNANVITANDQEKIQNVQYDGGMTSSSSESVKSGGIIDSILKVEHVTDVKKTEVGSPSPAASRVSVGSDHSKGSFVGSKQVFVPFLKMNEVHNPSVKPKKIPKPNDPKFQLRRTSQDINIKKGKRQGKTKGLLDVKGTQNNGWFGNKSIGQETPSQQSDTLLTHLQKASHTKPGHLKDKHVMQSEANFPQDALDIEIGSKQKEQPNLKSNIKLNKLNFDLPSDVKQGQDDLNMSLHDQLSENYFYQSERQARAIYQDEELHVLIISIIMCLILKPERGTLDEFYCVTHPYQSGMENVLHLLHYHLNYPANQSIIPKLFKKVSQIHPLLAGQRMMKLLCASLFDDIYKGWDLIAKGAYGMVYECTTSLADPTTVAIKQLPFKESITERCVLHDIFTEITCLESFRLEPCVTDLYDYGVNESSYFIVMRKYPCSLREWRLKQSDNLNENLPLYLQTYKEILNSFAILHSHNVTHYDIKGDNILLDFPSKGQSYDESQIRITIGDLGECKMFNGEHDEFDVRNRGTEVIMSPEMRMLAINTRKDTDMYDRRRRVGTDRLSDVWSLGCLFFELMTGDILFLNQEEEVPSHQLDKLKNNVYLIDFLKYVLVKDPRMRPNISAIRNRYEHVHALLVNTASLQYKYISGGGSGISSLRGQGGLDSALDACVSIMNQPFEIIQEKGPTQSIKHSPQMMIIMRDIYLCTKQWLFQSSLQHDKLAVSMNITHLIIQSPEPIGFLDQKFNVLYLHGPKVQTPNGVDEIETSSFAYLAQVMDYLRQAAVSQGKIMFVEIERTVDGQQEVLMCMRELILLALNNIFKTSAYETFTLIKSQNLFFSLPQCKMGTISRWGLKYSKITGSYINIFPKYQCICGCSTIILKRHCADAKNLFVKSCNCNQYYKHFENLDCPSPGCNEFMRFMKKTHMIKWQSLEWGFVEKDDFVIGPYNTGTIKDPLHREILVSSQTIDANTEQVEKRESDMRILSNQSRRFNMTKSSGRYHKWRLYQCKNCRVWTHAYDEVESRFAILLNNRVKEIRPGLLSMTEMEGRDGDNPIKVPILSQIPLQLPF